jgi:hypothetical protein
MRSPYVRSVEAKEVHSRRFSLTIIEVNTTTIIVLATDAMALVA